MSRARYESARTLASGHIEVVALLVTKEQRELEFNEAGTTLAITCIQDTQMATNAALKRGKRLLNQLLKETKNAKRIWAQATRKAKQALARLDKETKRLRGQIVRAEQKQRAALSRRIKRARRRR